MPAITDTSSTVLVTGANGFVATWIVGDLLARGYSVRAGVRTEERGQHLLKTYASYGDKLKLFATGDMSAKLVGKHQISVNIGYCWDGVFDEAVKGVDAILHTAAAVHLYAKDPKEMIDPAIKGIVGILESILKHGTSVKRVVITSTCAAIKSFSTVPLTLSEENWNDDDVNECEEKGKDANPLAMYAASKTLAERAGWDFYKKHKSEINWDLSFLNPPWIFGPVKHEVKSLDSLNQSSLYYYKAVVEGDFVGGYPPRYAPGHGWVDVRDVSQAHVRALETPAAGGERIIIAAGSFVWQDIVDAVNSISPSPWKSHTAPFAKGDPEGERVRNITWVTDKEKKILGLKFRTLQESARDILEDYENHGWA
ncbi:hypothetical protein D9758_010929 [Tetrapyrgos nigripes]|uniref:NAD-dependent epimerase/dehydratase domain-containing protein n=1 Tax=Tetrapyrgos nigripes TaxID=182062 RepID=A0A8H5FTE6_9AGAR|nr:hypothetical protein D9758_010929 [Tetrapyrgos nigripes]